MPKLVQSADEAVAAIRTLNSEIADHPELAARLGQAHAFYVIEDKGRRPLFGFSKFVGYAGLTGPGYLDAYKELDGRNTEHALSTWFEEVRYGSPEYQRLLGHLADWMAQYGKHPRNGRAQKTRIMVLRPGLITALPGADDRRLLDLLFAVSDLLPAHQRHELRARL